MGLSDENVMSCDLVRWSTIAPGGDVMVLYTAAPAEGSIEASTATAKASPPGAIPRQRILARLNASRCGTLAPPVLPVVLFPLPPAQIEPLTRYLTTLTYKVQASHTCGAGASWVQNWLESRCGCAMRRRERDAAWRRGGRCGVGTRPRWRPFARAALTAALGTNAGQGYT